MANKEVLVEIGGDSSGLQSATQAAKSTLEASNQAMINSMNALKASFDGMGTTLTKVSTDFTNYQQKAKDAADAAAKTSTQTVSTGEQIKNFAMAAKDGMDKLAASIAKVNVVFAAVALAAAGGSSFKDAVKDVVKFTGENQKLARQMGTNATEASYMNMALGDIGSSSESYGEALGHLNKQIKTNEKGLNEHGIATRNNKGELLTGQEVMKNAVDTVGQYKAGQDQALISMLAFGKGAEDSMKFQKLNNQVLEDAKKKAQELGLVTTKDGVESVKKYKAALNDMEDVFNGVKNAMGEALIPGITKIAELFSEVGPTAVGVMREAMTTYLIIQDAVKSAFAALYTVFEPIIKNIKDGLSGLFGSGGSGITALEFFRNVLALVQVAVISMRVGFEVSCAAIGGFLGVLIVKFQGFADNAISMYQSIKNMSLKPLTDSFARANASVEKEMRDSANRIADIARKGREDIEKAMMGASRPPSTEPAAGPKPGGKTFEPPKDKETKAKSGPTHEDKLATAALAVRKATSEAEVALLKEQEKAELALTEDLYSRKKITVENYYAEKSKIMDKDFARQIELKKQDIQENEKRKPKDDIEKLKVKTEQIKLEGQLKVLEEQRANASIENERKLAAVIEKRLEAVKAQQIQSKIDTDMQLLNLEDIKNQQMLALHQIDDKRMIELSAQRENSIYEIIRESIKKRQELAEGDVDKQRELKAELENLERSHQLKIAQIQSEAVIESQSAYKKAYESTQQTLASSIEGLLTKTKTLKGALNDLFTGVLNSIARMQSEKWAKNIMESMNFGDLFGNQVGKNNNSSSGSSGGGSIFGSLFSGAGSLFSSLKSGGGSLFESFTKGLNSFDVGTNYVQNDQIAKIHKGERIVPAKYNNDDYGGKRITSNNNYNFVVSGPMDKRTQSQIFSAAARGANTALQRAGT